MGAISPIARPPYQVFRYSDKKRKYLTSRGFDVGMKFPVGDIQRQCRARTKRKVFVTDEAAVFLSAIIEYLCAEILEQAGLVNSPEVALSVSNIIQPTHLQRVFWEDQELRQMLNNLLSRTPMQEVKHRTKEWDLCEAFQSLSVERERKNYAKSIILML